MKFFKSKEKDIVQTILFVGIENCRCRKCWKKLAEAFFKKYAPSNYKVISVGTKPSFGNENKNKKDIKVIQGKIMIQSS